MPDSLVGPTARCLIGEQFYRTRVGDKYFYDNANFPHSFTPGNIECRFFFFFIIFDFFNAYQY